MMLKVKCGIFVCFYFGILNLGICSQTDTQDLERIVVSKSKVQFLADFEVNQQDFNVLPVSSPVEAIGTTPVDLQSRSPLYGMQTDFSLRASNFQGVLMLLDGQRINDPQTGHFNSDLPLTKKDIQLIKAAPGASSAVYGPDAIGGAISVITKKPAENKVSLEQSGGVHNSIATLFSISRKLENLGVRMSVEKTSSRGFHYDTESKSLISTFASNLKLPCGEYNLNFGYANKVFGAYDFYTPNSNYPSKEWTETELLNTGFNLEQWGFLIKPNFIWRRHDDKFMLDKTNIRSRYLNHHRNNMLTPNLYFSHSAGFLGRVGLGTEYGQEKLNSSNLGKHERNHRSVYLDNSKDLTEKLSSGISYRLDNYDGFGQVYTGSVDLRWKLFKNNSLRFGVARNMRVPSFTELYYSDTTTDGNPDLSAEKAINYQLGYDYVQEKMSLGSTFFCRQENDMIDWVKRTASQTRFQAENITSDNVFGLENYFRYSFNKYITLDLNYSYINKSGDKSGYIYKYGKNYIKHLANSVFTFNLPFGTQAVVFNFKKKPDRHSWFLVNTHIAYDLNKLCTVFFDVTNLFNVNYQEIEGVPSPGRLMEAGLRLDW